MGNALNIDTVKAGCWVKCAVTALLMQDRMERNPTPLYTRFFNSYLGLLPISSMTCQAADAYTPVDYHFYTA